MCLHIYEVLVQTFNLPQPCECAKRCLSMCCHHLPRPPLPPSIPSLPPSHPRLLYSSCTLPASLSSAPSPLFLRPMLRLILELFPWIPASSWRCLSTPAQEHLSWMCSTEHPNAPPGNAKGVLEGREGVMLVKVGVKAG